jgi:hypothetical protein
MGQENHPAEAPFKNLESALKAAKPGDKILVAQGNYFGLIVL